MPHSSPDQSHTQTSKKMISHRGGTAAISQSMWHVRTWQKQGAIGGLWCVNSLGFKPSHLANDSPLWGFWYSGPRGVNVLKFKVRSTLSTKTSVNPNRPTGTRWNSLQLTIPEGSWSTNELVTQIPSKDSNCWSEKSFPHIKLLCLSQVCFQKSSTSVNFEWRNHFEENAFNIFNGLQSPFLDVYRHPT